jgi:hypothetical protein
MLHVCYVLVCLVGKYGSNCENNCTCPDNAQDGCEKLIKSYKRRKIWKIELKKP